MHICEVPSHFVKHIIAIFINLLCRATEITRWREEGFKWVACSSWECFEGEACLFV